MRVTNCFAAQIFDIFCCFIRFDSLCLLAALSRRSPLVLRPVFWRVLVLTLYFSKLPCLALLTGSPTQFDPFLNLTYFPKLPLSQARFTFGRFTLTLSCLSVSPRRYLQLPFCFSWALFLVSDNFVITNVWFFFLSRHSNSFVFLHRFVSFISFLLFNYISCHPSKSGLSLWHDLLALSENVENESNFLKIANKVI